MNPANSESVSIGVVIPVINEAENLAAVVQNAWDCGANRVVVADGGSSDGTLTLAKQLDCELVNSLPGRGMQLNHGADQLDCTVVLFLHADCRLDANCGQQIRSAVTHDQATWGCFQQRIANDAGIYRWLEWGNRQRAYWQRLVYGDQGLWVRRELYRAAGGVPEIPLMEDFVLAQRLGRYNRPAILSGPITVNARRWERRGVIRQTLLNWRIAAMYRLGVSPSQLAKLYRRHDASNP